MMAAIGWQATGPKQNNELKKTSKRKRKVEIKTPNIPKKTLFLKWLHP
jgi:hypothetical protein